MKRFAFVTTACAAVALGMTFNAGSVCLPPEVLSAAP